MDHHFKSEIDTKASDLTDYDIVVLVEIAQRAGELLDQIVVTPELRYIVHPLIANLMQIQTRIPELSGTIKPTRDVDLTPAQARQEGLL